METVNIIAACSSILSIIIVIWRAGFGIGALQRAVKENGEKLASLVCRVDCIEPKVNHIEVKADLFWKIVETRMVDVLHSPHTPEFDGLLEKLQTRSLTLPEAERLKELCNEECANVGSQTKRLAAALVIARLEQIIYELMHGEGCKCS